MNELDQGWIDWLGTNTELTPEQIATAFAREDINPYIKEKGLLALQANPAYNLILLGNPEVILRLVEKYFITPKDAKYLLGMAGNALDNAHEMRGEEGWDNQLYEHFIAIAEFMARYPGERAVELESMQKELVEQISHQGLLTESEVLDEMKDREKGIGPGLLHQMLPEAKEWMYDE